MNLHGQLKTGTEKPCALQVIKMLMCKGFQKVQENFS